MLKSLLHQSSDVFKAISEAWEQSDKPELFTIKVIDAGKKGFLGFSHRPATISFTYHDNGAVNIPSSQHKKAMEKNTAGEKNSQKQRRSQQNNSNDSGQKNNDRAERTVKEQSRQKPQKKPVQNNQKQKNKPKPDVVQKKDVSAPVENSPDALWNEDMAKTASIWIEDLFKIFGLTGKVWVHNLQEVSQHKSLTIHIEHKFAPDSELERLLSDNLFVCACATLAVQSLRNKSGQRLKGLRIRISKAENNN